jgi:hypothetical protein
LKVSESRGKKRCFLLLELRLRLAELFGHQTMTIGFDNPRNGPRIRLSDLALGLRIPWLRGTRMF